MSNNEIDVTKVASIQEQRKRFFQEANIKRTLLSNVFAEDPSSSAQTESGISIEQRVQANISFLLQNIEKTGDLNSRKFIWKGRAESAFFNTLILKENSTPFQTNLAEVAEQTKQGFFAYFGIPKEDAKRYAVYSFGTSQLSPSSILEKKIRLIPKNIYFIKRITSDLD